MGNHSFTNNSLVVCLIYLFLFAATNKGLMAHTGNHSFPITHSSFVWFISFRGWLADTLMSMNRTDASPTNGTDFPTHGRFCDGHWQSFERLVGIHLKKVCWPAWMDGSAGNSFIHFILTISTAPWCRFWLHDMIWYTITRNNTWAAACWRMNLFESISPATTTSREYLRLGEW